MRAVLLFNPNATTTDERVRDVIASALSSELDLEVHPTKQRGHATHIAAGAVHAGVDAVFALGGDGTANEALQALAGTGVALGVIPGGGTNVLARALGLPNDPVAATSRLLHCVREGRSRRISLGQAGGRYFSFNAGFGFDAAVVRSVEQHPRLKRRLRQMAFVWLALQEWFAGEDRADPAIEASLPDADPDGPYLIAIVGNLDPYTFLGPRPMRVTPEAGPTTGLDLVAVRPLGTLRLLRIVASVFGSARHVQRPDVDHWHDLRGFTLRAPRPLPLMVDGDYAGEHREVVFRALPDALTVLS